MEIMDKHSVVIIAALCDKIDQCRRHIDSRRHGAKAMRPFWRETLQEAQEALRAVVAQWPTAMLSEPDFADMVNCRLT